MKTRKVRNVLLLAIITIICWFILAGTTTTGLSNPIRFYDMQWGVDKAVITWIISLFSIAPATVIILIMHLKKNYHPEW